MLLNLEPTRRITKSHWSVTGKKPSKKTGKTHRFESTLERDYLTLLEFDDLVEKYVEQPLTIRYSNDGKERSYTPDFLVIYKSSVNAKPVLSEIKYRADIQRHFSKYKPKFEAAAKFAYENGYEFKVITEEHIRTVHLQNAEFLNRYMHTEIDDKIASVLLAYLQDLQQSTPETLIKLLENVDNCREELLYGLWQLVSTSKVSCNLNAPITMHSKIWLNSSK